MELLQGGGKRVIPFNKGNDKGSIVCCTLNMYNVKLEMLPVLRHRIITNFSAEADGIKSTDVIDRLSKEV